MDNLTAKLYQLSKTVFTAKDLALIWQETNPVNLKAKIAYYIKRSVLIRLTRGVFAKDKNYNPRELATSIYSPSYISFETALRDEGMIFQHYDTVFVAGPWPKTMKIDNHAFTFRKLKDELLFNLAGTVFKDDYNIAGPERAFLDTIYLFPKYYFDNLSSLDWEKCFELVPMYKNQQMVKRLNKYYKSHVKCLKSDFKMKQLPKNAKLVFQGKIFEVWQWEQEMFNGSKEIFECLKRPNTAQVIPVVNDKILILEQEQPGKLGPFPSLPGGRCNGAEDSLLAAKREMLEESGYISDDLILWQEQNPIGKIIWTVYTFVARNCRYLQPPKLDAGEKIIVKLIDFEEFLLLADNPLFYEGELKSALLRCRFDPQAKKQFQKLLFEKN